MSIYISLNARFEHKNAARLINIATVFQEEKF
jgi:hypothetical protein